MLSIENEIRKINIVKQKFVNRQNQTRNTIATEDEPDSRRACFDVLQASICQFLQSV